MQTLIVPGFISLVVALAVSFAAPRFNLSVWKKQKRREQQLAVVERFVKLGSDMYVNSGIRPWAIRPHEDPQLFAEERRRFVEEIAPMVELRMLVGIIDVLFEDEGVRILASRLCEAYDQGVNEEGSLALVAELSEIRGQLLRRMYAEALEAPLDKRP